MLRAIVRALPKRHRALSDSAAYRFASRLSASLFLSIEELTVLGVFLFDECTDVLPPSLRMVNSPEMVFRAIVALVFFACS
jgi:hypothetical protein